jgi:hypothetical protein
LLAGDVSEEARVEQVPAVADDTISGVLKFLDEALLAPRISWRDPQRVYEMAGI